MGGASLRWRISVEGRLCGQRPARGACRSEGLVGGEHPPDRLGELAKNGPKHLRWALIEAATHAARHPIYRDRYQRTKTRLGK